MTHGMWCAHAKLTTWATRVRVNQRENVTCEVCCSHPPSVAADCYQLWAIWLQQKKSCKVSLLSSFVKKLHNGSPRSTSCSFTSSDVLDFWWIFMSFTKNPSIATKMYWMKKTTDAISGIARKESVRVALLQTHGEDDAILLMLRWSLNGVSSVHCVHMCWERSTNSVCI